MPNVGKQSVLNIHKCCMVNFWSCAVNRSNTGGWAKRIKASRSEETELHDQMWSGHLATTSSSNMVQSTKVIIDQDHHIISKQLTLQISGINEVQYSKECASGLLKSDILPETSHENLVFRFLESFLCWGWFFLPWGITCDKTWAYYFEPEMKVINQWCSIICNYHKTEV